MVLRHDGVVDEPPAKQQGNRALTLTVLGASAKCLVPIAEVTRVSLGFARESDVVALEDVALVHRECDVRRELDQEQDSSWLGQRTGRVVGLTRDVGIVMFLLGREPQHGDARDQLGVLHLLLLRGHVRGDDGAVAIEPCYLEDDTKATPLQWS